MMSTGGSLAPSSLVISPTWIMSGKCFLVTWIGKASISLAQSGVMPWRTAARGKPPIPSKREPMVSMGRPWRGRGRLLFLGEPTAGQIKGLSAVRHLLLHDISQSIFHHGKPRTQCIGANVRKLRRK